MEKHKENTRSNILMHLKDDAIGHQTNRHFSHEAPILNTGDWLYVAGAFITLLIAIAVGIHYFQNL
jgi:hypothetical protein